MIVCSVASPEPVLSREMLERAMAARSNRSLLLIDLGMPRNVARERRRISTTSISTTSTI